MRRLIKSCHSVLISISQRMPCSLRVTCAFIMVLIYSTLALSLQKRGDQRSYRGRYSLFKMLLIKRHYARVGHHPLNRVYTFQNRIRGLWCYHVLVEDNRWREMHSKQKYCFSDFSLISVWAEHVHSSILMKAFGSDSREFTSCISSLLIGMSCAISMSTLYQVAEAWQVYISKTVTNMNNVIIRYRWKTRYRGLFSLHFSFQSLSFLICEILIANIKKICDLSNLFNCFIVSACIQHYSQKKHCQEIPSWWWVDGET